MMAEHFVRGEYKNTAMQVDQLHLTDQDKSRHVSNEKK